MSLVFVAWVVRDWVPQNGRQNRSRPRRRLVDGDLDGGGDDLDRQLLAAVGGGDRVQG